MNFIPYPISTVDRRTAFKIVLSGVAVALLCLLVDTLIIVHVDPSSPTGGDGPFFIGLAKALASGRGYSLPNAFWPNQPNMDRSPLWPFILSVPARLFPNANPYAVLKFTGAVLHAISAALMVVLTFQLTGSLLGAALAGGFLAIYPPASGLVIAGYSEIAFLLVLLAGVILILEGPRARYLGSLLCGLGVLARSNFLLLPLMLLLLVALLRPRVITKWHNLRVGIVCTVFFLVPPAIWVVRNYLVSGYFPALSSMEGEAFYGGNNARVASDLLYWGYWVMPNEIPGEKTKKELAQTRSELELSRYYHQKGMDYIRANWFGLPRLILGKLVRGYVPVPWVPLAASYVAFFFRACLYVAFTFSWFAWRERNEPYAFAVGAIFLVTLLTTVVYYGTFRFTFCVEPFLLPIIVGGALVAVQGLRAPAVSSRHRQARLELLRS